MRVVSEEGRPVQYPYWFVIIRNFNLEKDKASGATSIGVWRFGHEDEAFDKFNELEPLYPSYVVKPPTAAQIAVRDRVRRLGLPKIHKRIEITPIKTEGDAQLEPTPVFEKLTVGQEG